MIKNKKDLEINIETANTIVKTAYKEVKAAKNMLDTALNIRNAALDVRDAAMDNYYGGSQNDSDAYIIARDNYNNAIVRSTATTD